MAQQSSFYNTDGTTRTYPSSKHIASKQHVAVYFKSATTSAWSIIEDGLYDLVNNSIVFSDAPDSVLYSQIEIRVADTAAELTDSPSDIALVAGAIGDISAIVPSLPDIATIADNLGPLSEISASIVPNIAEILLADTNATTATTQAGIATTQADVASTKASEASASANDAQLRAWEAEAKRMTADSYATEAEDVFVKVYTSDGNGTFTATNTTEYSALHWRNKAILAVSDQASNILVTPYGNLSATNVQGALNELDSEKAPLASPAFTGTPTAPDFSYKPTPVTVTSWSYVTTTITLNVDSHTFVAGDYIEVGGLTATTNIPNGVHLVTSVTTTTIVFTYALTPTGTAGVSSATVKGYVTINGRTNGISEGQTWQDVTASRAIGTTYTNTTGKPIMVHIHASGSGYNIVLILDGTSTIVTQVANPNVGDIDTIIPNNTTYALSSASAVYEWKELR